MKFAAVAGSLAAVAGIAGAFAYLSDFERSNANGKVGTVAVNVADADAQGGPVRLHHYVIDPVASAGQPNPVYKDVENLVMNPGDNDPSISNVEGGNPESGRRDGTDHEFAFNVENSGSKSISTRTTITVTGLRKDGITPLTKDELAAVMLSTEPAATHVPGASSKHDAPSPVLTPARKIKESDHAIVYDVSGELATGYKVLNGVGAGAEIEAEAAGATSYKQVINMGIDKAVANTHNYAAGTTVDPVLEGSQIFVEVKVQALQFRNTATSDWNDIFTNQYQVTIPGSNATETAQ